jgi:hypothetical protein
MKYQRIENIENEMAKKKAERRRHQWLMAIMSKISKRNEIMKISMK